MGKIRVGVNAESRRLRESVMNALQWEDISPSILPRESWQRGKQQAKEYDAIILACETAPFFEKAYASIPVSVRREVFLIGVCEAGMQGRILEKAGCEFVWLRDLETEIGKNLFSRELIVRIKTGKTRGRRYLADSREETESRFLVAIGSSAGGPKALSKILKDLKPDTCGILIVQHLSIGFSGTFAQYLNLQTELTVKEAETGETVRNGTVYLASDGCQMSVSKSGDGYILKNIPGKKVNGFAPSVDYLFSSVSRAAGKNAMGIVLTGMGEDGARGLLDMKKAGASTAVQNKETSEIYNMPSAAVHLGGADKQIAIENMADEIKRFCRQRRNQSGR